MVLSLSGLGRIAPSWHRWIRPQTFVCPLGRVRGCRRHMACAALVRSLGTALEERGWHAGRTNSAAGVARSPAALQDGAQCETVQALTSAQTGLLSAQLCRNLTHGQLIADYINATE